MTEVSLDLRQHEAKLVYLAIAHHLGRPGSELDPITKQPVERGLADLGRELQPQLRMAVSKLSLDDNQAKRLQGGMLGSITELKAYTMVQPRVGPDGSQRRSTVPGFDGTLLHLFPEVAEDVEASLGIAEEMLVLKRRLDVYFAEAFAAAEPEEPEAPKKKGWWPFRR